MLYRTKKYVTDVVNKAHLGEAEPLILDCREYKCVRSLNCMLVSKLRPKPA